MVRGDKGEDDPEIFIKSDKKAPGFESATHHCGSRRLRKKKKKK